MPTASPPFDCMLALALALPGCEQAPPPELRDADGAQDTRRDTRDAQDLLWDALDDGDAEAADEPPADVAPEARCDAFFNPASVWDEGFSGQVFFEYGGPPLTAWEVRVDFGVTLELKGAWSGSGLLLEDPVLDGTAIVIAARLGAESGALGVEIRRFDIGLTALHATRHELPAPIVTLDDLTCGDLR